MNLAGKKLLLLFMVAISFFVSACTDNDSTEAVPENGFDKTTMLTSYADKMIIPAYTGMQQQLLALETALNVFLADPSAANQQLVKPVFKDAYLQFQRVSVFQIGPAEAVLLNNFLNTFPADVAAIENNSTSGTYNLEVNAATTQQGFPALDYLLFSDQAVQKFKETAGANRKKYVQNILTRMKTLVSTVLTDWNTTYRAQFISNTRADVGSPIGFMINQFAYELDQLKGPRIGWPYGKQSGGMVFADKSEAYYAGFSGALAVENLTSVKKAYIGVESGKGIADYLVALQKEQLNADVLQQFEVTIAKLKAIPDPLATAFTSHKELVDAAYREMQNLLTLLKTDVASATGVRITYQDSDGD